MDCIIYLTAAALVAFSPQPEDTKTRFEAIAKQIKIFPTGEFLYGRGNQLDRRVSKAWTEPWYGVLHEISSTKHKMPDLVALLNNEDPKVRTLALAALFQREDAKLLPQIAALMEDKEKTLPELRVVRADAVFKEADPLPQDLREQTVGDVAKKMVGWWLEQAGYTAKDFPAYWAARKDRASCASWYVARMLRATGAISPFQESRAEAVQKLRKEIDRLAQPDRDWTLLYVACHNGAGLADAAMSHFCREQELLNAGKRLGPEQLMKLLSGKGVGTDPDLSAEQNTRRGRFDLGRFVLRHASALLRPEDAPALLALEDQPELGGHPYVIAAAHLQPDKAKKWLRDALERYNGKFDADRRADLAAALWHTVGEPEINFLVDWFYGEKVTNNHTPQTETFLDAMVKVRGLAPRKLTAKIVNDPRLEKLDWLSLRALILVANGWVKEPVVSPRALYPNWERGGHAPETEADGQLLQEWRGKLKTSVSAWFMAP
jgi:hypothetical protein